MIAAVVPLKTLRDAKGRLSDQLEETARVNLVLNMLCRTLDALFESGAIHSVALVTDERDLTLPEAVHLLPDGGSLNGSLSLAARWAFDVGATKLLIIPADLPGITAQSVRRLMDTHKDSRGVALARTQDGGTGALLLAPPNAITPAFGPNSFTRHEKLALMHGFKVQRILDPAFSFDLDTSDDLALWAGCH